MTEKNIPIVTTSSEIAWECPYYHVREDGVRFPDGSDGTFYVVDMPDFVSIVPLTTDNQIVLIRTYRYTLKQWVWEVPAGTIKAGQTVEEAVREELREEIGGVSENLQFLMKSSAANGFAHIYAHFYLARDVILHEPQHEAAEFMTVHSMSIAEAYSLVERGEMNDVNSMTALFLARRFLEISPSP